MLIPFPSFESNLNAILGIAEDLRAGRERAAADSMVQLQSKLGRIQGSARHTALTEHVRDALRACRRGEAECALHILMAALSAFLPGRAA